MALITHIDSSIPCSRSLPQVISGLQACPMAKKLWQEVRKEGPFKVFCGPDTDFGLIFGGLTYPEDREIYLLDDPGRAQERVFSLVFELLNLKQAKDYQEIQNHMCALTPDTYADSIEDSESKVAREAHRIATACIAQGHWPPDWIDESRLTVCSSDDRSAFGDDPDSNKMWGHTAHYFLEWYEECAPKAQYRDYLIKFIAKLEEPPPI